MCSHRLAIAKLVRDYKDPLFSPVSSQISRQNKQELWEFIRQQAVAQGAVQYARKSWKEVNWTRSVRKVTPPSLTDSRQCVGTDPTRHNGQSEQSAHGGRGHGGVHGGEMNGRTMPRHERVSQIDRVVLEIIGSTCTDSNGEEMTGAMLALISSNESASTAQPTEDGAAGGR